MDVGILAARREIATKRLAAAANTIGKTQGLELTFAPAPAKDPAVKLLYQLEAAAELLETVVRVVAPEDEEAEQARQEAIAQAEANTTPAALKAARDAGLDLTTVTGTGADGKITKADVDAAIEALG